jgi:hypothetical protein
MDVNWSAVAASVPSVAGFTNDLAAHLEPGGIVVSCPEFFIMLRPVLRDAPVEQLTNPWWRWPAEECDSWMVWIAAGDVRRAFDLLLPLYGPRKWLAFQTEGPPRFWRFNSFQAWLKAAATSRQSHSKKSR